ncbi:adenylate/guanylate cyclase domain-containing protein [Aridibaculum aurantiacum]|uniref:adenylate/guanylate cyclase domain-containing protein n=1 Tax=Aridibaculum aurantiacum TaxID=2810307 RepID=UPI001A964728|nr:adenylate/guanylate cyclase domain-containing protein [Aridibaculum aurantiacum]
MSFEVLTLEEMKKEKERLFTLYQYNILDTEVEEPYNKLVEVASYICDTPISFISLVDRDRQWFKASRGLYAKETPREMSFCQHTIKHDEVLEVPDTLEDERFRSNPLVINEPNIRFYAGSPLITSTGHKIGTLCVLDQKPRTLDEKQKNILKVLAEQVVTQMELHKQKQQLLDLNDALLKELEKKLDEQNKVLNLFTRFVPDEIVAKHLRAGGGEIVNDAEAKFLTVLFCDMRGYMSIVENLAPQAAVNILNRYYSIMSDVISVYSGMVNQYVGDEIFATFGAPFSFPPYERNAVFCAMEMLEKLKLLNEECRSFTNGELKIGIGIHAGEVITGTLGSKNKIEYSITGDTVNTGKRIESLTQNKPNSILISLPVYEQVKDWVEVKEWPPVAVKGKRDPVKIFEVLRKKEIQK